MSAPSSLRDLDRPAPVLSGRDLSLRLGSTAALTAVDIDLWAGEVLALVGPNGAGKSTLLAVLAGDLTPDTGQVTVRGTTIGSIPPLQLARVRAVQTQEARVSFAFTAGEVVRMGRAPWQGTPLADADDAVIARAMDITETTALADRQFPSLSGGEKARTAFSKALAQETAVLMLDEPTAALDIGHQEAVLAQARDRAGAGAAVVVVLHDLTLAAAYADRVMLLDRGRLTAAGSPAEVLTAERLSDIYRYPVDVLLTTGGDLVILPVRPTGRDHRAAPPFSTAPIPAEVRG